jgi:hypothetical protein
MVTIKIKQTLKYGQNQNIVGIYIYITNLTITSYRLEKKIKFIKLIKLALKTQKFVLAKCSCAYFFFFFE